MVLNQETKKKNTKLTLESLNELLIKEGHAVEYHGGKR